MLASSPVNSSHLSVVRVPPGLTWRALDGADVVGSVTAFLRPDDRWFVRYDTGRQDALGALLGAVAGNTVSDLYVTVRENDADARDRLGGLGFSVNRRDGIYVIPTDPGRTGLTDVPLPDDFVAISAADADEDDLRLLDNALRQDVPGTDGWAWYPPDFHDETYDGGDFDPATYLVAADVNTGEYAGLVRIWVGPGRPRLGLVAVAGPYRRRGVARALLARTFRVLDERGRAEVTAEVDDQNTAALALVTGIGARRIGGTVEFVKRRSAGH